MVWDGTNRRRFPRVHYECTVRIRHKGSAEVFQTTTENIGTGGICVMLPKALAVFSPAELSIYFKGKDDAIDSDGRIVWSVRRSQISNDIPSTFDTGIEFVRLEDKDKERLRCIVKECCEKNPS